MKVNDLMVGDYICLDGDENYDCPIQVQQIRYQGVDEIIADSDVYGIDDIIPIPITEEILEKNGWRKESITIDGDYADWCGEIPICQEEDEFNYERIELTYVHQLQHLLRLVGVQKEIEL